MGEKYPMMTIWSTLAIFLLYGLPILFFGELLVGCLVLALGFELIWLISEMVGIFIKLNKGKKYADNIALFVGELICLAAHFIIVQIPWEVIKNPAPTNGWAGLALQIVLTLSWGCHAVPIVVNVINIISKRTRN